MARVVGVVLVVALLLVAGTGAQQQGLPFTLVPQGWWNIKTNGDDTTYGQGLTHRYVDGELRFLTLAYPNRLHEFRISTTDPGGLVASTTASWNLGPSGALNNFNGIWFEQSRNRLWITSAEDYTAVAHEAKITTLVLGNNGAISDVKTIRIEGIPAKRVYGGCTAVPSSLVAQLGGPYVCGWGGYTSLLNNGGGASIGATMYAIPDPATVPSGTRVTARTILDHAGTRGVRRTIPDNRFDNGAWLSPNSEGLGWMVWGDSYYNTGMWIGTNFVSVASLCRGECWYEDSTLQFDGRQFELHVWDGAALGSDRTRRPAAMVELSLPRGNTRVWEGNVTAGNIAGATYDATSRRLFLIGFPLGSDGFTGRLYAFSVDTGGPAPPDSRDAVVSEWSEWTPVTSDWTACVGGMQSREEARTRTVLVPATGSGVTPPLRETRQGTRACSTAPLARLSGRLVASGLQDPVGLVAHPTDTRALLVPTRSGRVRILRDNRLEATDFLDISSDVADRPGGGLLGLAFAPDFSTTRRLYLSFTDRSGNLVVSRFLGVPGSTRAEPASRVDLAWPDGNRYVSLPEPTGIGGGLAFGDDGLLFLAIGDKAEDPDESAQQLDSLLGKVLRLDVSVPDGDARGYRVPSTNPFVGGANALHEVWALGLREPQVPVVDPVARGGTGVILIPDRGADVREELNAQPRGSAGRNYGWPYKEGMWDRGFAGATGLTDPVLDYGRDVGRRIVSGLIYRGTALGSAFAGRYIFADAGTSRVWSVALDPVSGQVNADSLSEHTADLAAAASLPAAFGRDSGGELYIASETGSIYRIELTGTGGGSRNSDGPTVGRARPR